MEHTKYDDEAVKAYFGLITSCLHGLKRFAEGRIAALQLLNAVLIYRSTPIVSNQLADNAYASVLKRIDAITVPEY